MKIFGNDYNTPDGKAVMDYTHVVDLAKAHIKSVERLIQKKNKSEYEFFNVGTGNGYSVLEMLEKFQEVNNVKVPHSLVSRRVGDIEKIYANTDHANTELGWKSEKGLGEMMESSWDWQQNVQSKG